MIMTLDINKEAKGKERGRADVARCGVNNAPPRRGDTTPPPPSGPLGEGGSAARVRVPDGISNVEYVC